MSILRILELAGVAASEIVALLNRLKEVAPDSAAAVDEKLAQLNAAATAENLARLGAVVPGEILNVFKGNIEPKDHPSDAI